MALTPAATFLPATTLAAARRSSIRPLVQEPKKTRSMLMSVIGVPGSERVKREAEAEGLDRIFKDAGFEWREPGCSMCIASNGERVPPGQRSVSTSNRNFVGRQGPGARTHLASPAMAAAAAIKGAIADVRKL